MDRKKYLQIKSELKELGNKIRKDRKDLIEDQRKRLFAGVEHRLDRDRQDFKIRHIFMSLLRGRTRIQIEQNFKDVPFVLYDFDRRIKVERRIQELCVENNLDFEASKNGAILKVTEKIEALNEDIA